ncbi:MAG: hypothetical protein ING71_16285 [Rhodocyclaceae bacterium]|nr:hypothetical protein [Rhodocyclaceae bacterium]
MSSNIFVTKNGKLDQAASSDLSALPGRTQAHHLHLHGGLVSRAKGESIATSLASQSPTGMGLDHSKYAQSFFIWQSGALEVLPDAFINLVTNDRLYKRIVAKLIELLMRRLNVPVSDSGAAAPRFRSLGSISGGLPNISQIERMIGGLDDLSSPFAKFESNLFAESDIGTRSVGVVGSSSESNFSQEFRNILQSDRGFLDSIASVASAATTTDDVRLAATRSAGPSRIGANGYAMLARLNQELTGRVILEKSHTRGAVAFGTKLLTAAGEVAGRCYRRFKSGRDHGLHATVVEEVVRQFYGDFLGIATWKAMTDDALAHSSIGGFGRQYIDRLIAMGVTELSITAHSAGSIIASGLIDYVSSNNLELKFNLLLLAPAIRSDAFAKLVVPSTSKIKSCHLLRLSDALERSDPVLGPKKGFIYPSSLLYLVSGLAEQEDSGAAYVDAPILGMQRFTNSSFLIPELEAVTDARINNFFAGQHRSIGHSIIDGVCDSQTHGGFDSTELCIKTMSRFVAREWP